MSFVVPAFSATNPFMDVPLNHWAYDAIGQLAADGILSGYPDGTYKGKQPTTRYEMASALARMLAVVDMTKASKQDIENIRRLVLEFDEELEALGVRVDELDERVRMVEDRLGGWHIHGSLALDVKNQSAKNAADRDGDGSIGFDEARIFFEKRWEGGDATSWLSTKNDSTVHGAGASIPDNGKNEYIFVARLRDEGGQKGEDSDIRFDRFYVTMPFFFDSALTVGRQNWDVEGDYKISLPETGSWTGGSVLTDRLWQGFGLEKNFGLGSLKAYFSHPTLGGNAFMRLGKDRNPTSNVDKNVQANVWEAFLMANLQFTEQIGLDIGGQVFVGDNAEINTANNDGDHVYTARLGNNGVSGAGGYSFNNLWTVFAGLRFSFNDNIAVKGVFYHQAIDAEGVTTSGARSVWSDVGYGIRDIDDANHWAAIIDVKQEALKYTSVWLEYGQYDAGFWAPQGWSAIFPSESKVLGADEGAAQLGRDLKYWRVALGQEWNDKWATHIFYYGYNMDRGAGVDEWKPAEYGLGIQYTMNDYTTLGLNYIHVDGDGNGNNDEDNVIRFRTKVTF